jgi:hypothetical protein
MGAIAAARGQFIMMGGADDSYDFLQITRFVEKLRQGFDLVQGYRLPLDGGTVLPGRCRFCIIGGAIQRSLSRFKHMTRPRSQPETQVMKAAANFHDEIPHDRFPEANRVFAQPTSLEATDNVFDDQLASRQLLIRGFLCVLTP